MTLDRSKEAEILARTDAFMAGERPAPRGRIGRLPVGGDETRKPFGWEPGYFTDWATVSAMLEAIDLPKGAHMLDVGCGAGWTSLFLAEAGYDVLGYDLVPASIEAARRRAERSGLTVRFEVADMEALPAGEPADAVLLYDALHHSRRQRDVLRSAAGRIRPGGWLLLGEPTWLHVLSPGAHATRRDLGWTERGPTLRGLRRDLRATGFGQVRRFFEPTRPYESRVRGFGWQLVRLVAENAWVAPGVKTWLAARRDA
ncbi:MAG TPA: methyltransferase domain-containing protein [Thermoleophilaceae bacterium]|jgi:SAM-dependent methyltransferase